MKKMHPDLINLKTTDVVMSLVSTSRKGCQPLVKGQFYSVSMIAASQNEDDNDLYISVYYPEYKANASCNLDCNCIDVASPYSPFSPTQFILASKYSECFVSKYDIDDKIKELEDKDEFELCAKLKDPIIRGMFNKPELFKIITIKEGRSGKESVKMKTESNLVDTTSTPEISMQIPVPKTTVDDIASDVPDGYVKNFLQSLQIPINYLYLMDNGKPLKFVIFDYQETTGTFYVINVKNGLVAQAKIGSVLKFSNE